MVAINYQGEALEVDDGETVLECLERNGKGPAAGCRAGSCQSCLMRASDGTVPAVAQEGLGAPKRALGYFLACVCRPTENLSIGEPEIVEVPARLAVREQPAPDIVRLLLQPHGAFAVTPGQFIHVLSGDGLTSRPYSVASTGQAGEPIELHVRVVPGGCVSSWLGGLAVDAHLRIRGPYGSCIYTPEANEQPLVLAGLSTGLAPLLGILRDALRQGHRGPITLYHGAANAQGLYLGDTLAELEAEHHNVRVVRATMQDGPLEELVLRDHSSAAGLRAYICGAPTFVARLKKRLFIAGADLKELHSDAFTETARPSRQGALAS